MPLPIPDLDDRRFDDLVAELQQRLQRHVPDLTQLSPGDPAYALVDLFAWLTETVIYRANRIPDRQRLAFLNLLQIPLRPARPARGVVCLDPLPGPVLPALVRAETPLQAGRLTFTTNGEVQPLPLELRLLVKHAMDAAALAAEGISLNQLREQYGVEPAAFRPLSLLPGRDPISTVGSLDGALYLAFALPRALIEHADRVRRQIAGTILNVALAPNEEIDGDLATRLSPRRLTWDLAWWPAPVDKPGEVSWLPLEIVADSSRGGRQTGVVRLRLPRSGDFLRISEALDPQYAGLGETPPEPPADLVAGQLLFWLRLTSPDGDPIKAGTLGVNGVEVLGQGVARDLMLGAGTGRPDQVVQLPDADVDDADVRVEVEELGRFVAWRQVDHFAGQSPDSPVYVVDGQAGTVRFGDGVRGRRPPVGARIRAAWYRFGGGSAGNLPAGSIRSIAGLRLKVRHESPTRGGIDGETIADAERRIPAFLAHRERAVTAEDFAALARDNPLRPIARADAVAGFFPGANLASVRRNLPGVISVFVLPPGEPAMAAAPRPTAGTLRDVFEYLSARTLLGSELYVLSPQFQPISIAVSLEVVDPATEQQVFRAVEQALLAYLWPLPPHGLRGKGWPRGRSIEINELRTQAGRVDGVEAVNALRLFHQDLTTLAWLELSDRQALPLTDYQLPELMAVALQSGEGQPVPPRAFAPGGLALPGSAGSPGSSATGRAVPVPVIPDVC
ncbi:MAG: putative baseplate assembly protein [Candidatus Accumulibacter sp.]|uniref:Baseplate assembly protein n=1 Tax=Candidatus Accumulibacter proximus TaxID=2954385 RepID=A0A935PYN3_9PROT|nr:putative baseplate assembly protein [Candidatus Accumulibacter proximus]